MKKVAVLVFLVFLYNNLFSQGVFVDGKKLNTISTAVPFLMISPDPVSSAMGECGVATGNDVYSMHWNPAKYAVANEAYESSAYSVGNRGRLGVFYSPWLRSLVRGINYYGIYASGRISENSALSSSFRMLNLGDIMFTNVQGNVVNYKPYEWAADLAWSQKLSDHWYAAVAGRFIFSNLTSGQVIAGSETKPGSSVAADLSVFYLNKVPSISPDDELSFGLNISNIGSKMNYYKFIDETEFIPTNLRIGASYRFFLPDEQTLRLSLDFNKLLVPTPPLYLMDSTGSVVFDDNDEPVIAKGMSPDVSVLNGMIQSFYDAPDGYKEELREITIGAGAEYMLYNTVSLRGGYFYEHASKGNRKFVTLGLGFHYEFIGANVSFIWADRLSPLNKTLRLGLSFAL